MPILEFTGGIQHVQKGYPTHPIGLNSVSSWTHFFYGLYYSFWFLISYRRSGATLVIIEGENERILTFFFMKVLEMPSTKCIIHRNNF